MNAAQTLATIKRRFAGRDQSVEHAFASSESFRGLCRDYLSCAAALVRWQESHSPEAQARAEEYTALLSELAREIETRLRAAVSSEHQPPSPGGQ